VLDVGHANMGEGVDAAFEIMKDRKYGPRTCTTITAKRTSTWFRSWPMGGPVDWKRTMSLLRSRPNQYPLLLELREVEGMEHPLDRVNEVFDRLENLRDE